jgi:hypothetical protein
MNTFSDLNLWDVSLQTFLDTLSDVLIKSVTIFPNQAPLDSFLLLCCIYFPIKIVLIKN